jgi:hypothetical protein
MILDRKLKTHEMASATGVRSKQYTENLPYYGATKAL